MRRQLHWHLAHARAAASGSAGARAGVGEVAQALTRTLARLHAERSLAIDVDGIPDVTVHVPVEDLEEMLGNLIDNACKWASSRVVISAADVHRVVVIVIDDDGPGLEPSMRERVLQRGVRADETAPGAGLGLAIVRELADAYGGSIALEASPLGGVRARLQLPAA
jgi:signal transduction histidine kinase